MIPAAGHSRRMGQPKLLLPYRGTTVIGQVLSVLSPAQIATRCVVVRQDDAALKQEAERHGAWVVQPGTDPPDMRASVEFALSRISQRHHPHDDDGWLLIPADHPLLSAELLRELLAVWQREQPQILVPTYHGRRGHPVMFRWRLARKTTSIPTDRGLNWLLETCASQVVEWPCEFAEVTQDLDTPEDYERLQKS